MEKIRVGVATLNEFPVVFPEREFLQFSANFRNASQTTNQASVRS